MFPSLDLSRFTYAFVDYRGYGKSADMPGNYGMAELSADALALADYLGWSRFHLMGHSMGGMAVQRLMVDAPDRVKSVVAITPVPASGTPLDEDGKALFHGAAASDDNRRMIIGFSTGNRLSAAWVESIVKDSRVQTLQDAFHGYMRAFTETNFLEEARGNATPILVLPGEFDFAIPEEAMRQTLMQWYPNASLEVVRNSGHYPMQETPVYLATQAQAFFEKYA